MCIKRSIKQFGIIIISLLSFMCSKNVNTKEYPYVVGVIEDLQIVEIINKVKGKPSKHQTRIKLSILEAFDYNGDTVDIEDYDYPEFAGDSSLIDKFEIGQKVKIVCTTKTGRHISTIESAE